MTIGIGRERSVVVLDVARRWVVPLLPKFLLETSFL